MLIEERTYVLHTGASQAEYLDTYERLGLPVQLRVLGGFMGYFVTEFGVQNQLTHLWAYTDLEDRRRRRALLAEEPEWQECLHIIRPMIMTMQNKIMYPTGFSPLGNFPLDSSVPGTAFHSDFAAGGRL